MGTPLQVRVRLCVIGLALLPVIAHPDGVVSRADAQETGASCVDPSRIARSVVSIVWRYGEPRRDGSKEIVGERATAWFYASPRFLVTAAHFAKELPADGWQEVELRQSSRVGEPDVSAQVRLRVTVQGKISEDDAGGTGRSVRMAEDLAILELQEPFPDAQVLDVQPVAPSKNATVLILGYPKGQMKAALGIIREHGTDADRYPGLELLEVQGSDRLLLNGGASGAPVLDCRQGRVVAVLNGLLTGPSLPFLPPENSVIPTPWGSPTNTAVPAGILEAIRNRVL
ncbi:S1 family peptidase [Microvirga calopogonii]|uniref:S1 family peptidase n=1 Tax=Microvirga calopogonii TaxID=2078013 RepID=UPI000E0D2450|nr:serine protease [Microvirga calopogonii]